MLELIILLFGSLLALWILLESATRILHILWEIFMEVFDRKYINLSSKFGEWASK